MPLHVQYERNLIDGGSSSPMYHTRLTAGVWEAWNVVSASLPMRGFQVVSEPGNILAAYASGGDGRVYRLVLSRPGATSASWNGWFAIGAHILMAQIKVLIVRGQITIVGLGLNRKAYIASFSGSSWTAWAELGGTSPQFLQLDAAVTHDDRVVVFAILSSTHEVNYIEQTAPSFTSWNTWSALGTSPAMNQIVCQATADNRLAIFALDQTNLVRYTEESAPSSPGVAWNAWNVLGTPPSTDQIASLATPDGRLAVFAVSNYSVLMIQQTRASAPAAPWDSWIPIGAAPPAVISVVPTTTPANRLAVFSAGHAQPVLWTIQQTAASSPTTTWDRWEPLNGSPRIQEVAPIVSSATLHLFATGWSKPFTPEQLSRVNRKAVVKYFTVS